MKSKAAVLNATAMQIEALEERRLLTVSTASWFASYFQTGNSWVEQDNDTGTFVPTTYTVKGSTTFNNAPATEIDESQTSGGTTQTGMDFVGTDSAGDFVGYGDSGDLYGGAPNSDINSPYSVVLPSTMTAGVPVSENFTDQGYINGSSANIAPITYNDVFTLQSETPSPVTVPEGTFNAYEITDDDTGTQNAMLLNSDTYQEWWAPGAGEIKLLDTGDGSISELGVGTQDHLAISPPQIPTTAVGKALPSLVVNVLDANNNPDVNATGSVMLTLQSASKLNTSTGTLVGTTTQPIVGGMATFNNLNVSAAGAYTITATDTNSDTPAQTSTFKIGSTSLVLGISTVGVAKAGVQTGNRILYTILLTKQKSIQTLSLVATLPTGLVPTGIAGGSYSSTANTITWTNPNIRTVNFDLVVPDATTLSKAVGASGSITISATCQVTYTDSTEDVASASNSVKIDTNFEVSGTLEDVVFNWPKISRVATDVALAGATVTLIDSTGAVVATTVTAGNGSFKLAPDQGGVYTLEFSLLTHVYSDGSNALNPMTAYAGRSITVPLANTKATPVKTGDLTFPRAVLEQAANVIMSLHNLTTTSQFQGLASFNLNLFEFDTTSAESVINGLLGTQASPTALMNVKALDNAQPDPWVAAINMLAGLIEANARFQDQFKIADITGKALAVTVGAAVAKGIGPWAGKLGQTGTPIPFTTWTISKLSTMSINVNRVSTLTTLGALLPTTLNDPSLLGQFKFQSSTKNVIYAVVFNFLRYATDIFNGKLIGDLGFEAVFNIARLVFDAAVLSPVTGVTLRSDLSFPYNLVADGASYLQAQTSFTTLQDVINSAVANRNSYVSSTDQMLESLGRYDDYLHTEAVKGIRNFSVLNNISSFLRGTTGILEIQEKFQQYNPNTPLSTGQSTLQGYLTSFNSGVSSVTGKSASKLSADALMGALVASLLTVAEQSYYAPDINQVVTTGQFSSLFEDSVNTGALAGPSTPAPVLPTEPPASTQNDILTGESVASTSVSPAAATVSTASDSATFINDLTQISVLVKTDNTTGIGTLGTPFSNDEQALFDNDWVVLDNKAAQDIASLPAASVQKVNTFDQDVNTALTTTALALGQLYVWSQSPSTGSVPAVTAQVNAAIAAVKAAASLAPGIQNIIAPFTIPVALEIDDNNLLLQATVGSTQTLTFTVTNIGTQTSVDGTITFVNTDGSLILQAPAQQDLTPLAPGASATYSWPVDVLTPTNSSYGAAYQIQAITGSVTDSTAGQLSVG